MFIEKEKYKIIIENTIIETIDLIIINNEWKILLWLRNNEPLKWEYYIPWGRRYKNELINDSIRRKAYEELWIQIDPNQVVFLWIYDDIYPNSMFDNTSSHYSSITYMYKLTKSEENNLRKDTQHSDLKFFDVNDNTLNNLIKIRIKDMRDKGLL